MISYLPAGDPCAELVLVPQRTRKVIWTHSHRQPPTPLMRLSISLRSRRHSFPTRALGRSRPSEKTDKRYKPRQRSQDVASARLPIEFQPQSAAPSAHAQHLWQFTEEPDPKYKLIAQYRGFPSRMIQRLNSHRLMPHLPSGLVWHGSNHGRLPVARFPAPLVHPQRAPGPPDPAKNRYPRAGFHARIGSLLKPLE